MATRWASTRFTVTELIPLIDLTGINYGYLKGWGVLLLKSVWPSSQSVVAELLSRVPLFHNPYNWTVACQCPLSMGFPSQEYWSGLQFRSPGDLSDPGIEPMSPTLQVNSLPTELQGIGSYWNSINTKLKKIE